MNRKRNNALAHAIIDSGWKQWEVADKAGLKEQRLSSIKAGRGQATLEEQKALSKLLKRPIEELFT